MLFLKGLECRRHSSAAPIMNERSFCTWSAGSWQAATGGPPVGERSTCSEVRRELPRQARGRWRPSARGRSPASAPPGGPLISLGDCAFAFLAPEGPADCSARPVPSVWTRSGRMPVSSSTLHCPSPRSSGSLSWPVFSSSNATFASVASIAAPSGLPTRLASALKYRRSPPRSLVSVSRLCFLASARNVTLVRPRAGHGVLAASLLLATRMCRARRISARRNSSGLLLVVLARRLRLEPRPGCPASSNSLRMNSCTSVCSKNFDTAGSSP